MQLAVGKKYYDRPKYKTLRDLIQDCAVRYGDNDAYRYHETPGGPEIIRSFRQFAEDIDVCGTALMNMGLSGKHVVIVGANCYEWAIAHNAVVNGTGVSVPLDRQLPEQEVINLCRRGQADAVIYGADHHHIALSVAADNRDIHHFICMKPGIISRELIASDPRFVSWDQIMERGRRLLQNGDRRFLDAEIDPEAMCSLLFTSGTTDISKGVMLSHRNITNNVHSAACTLDIKTGQRALSVLPLHHTFENTVGMYMILSYGCCICFVDSLRHLSQNLKDWEINIMVAVPLLYENIYRQIIKTLQKTGKVKLVQFLRVISNGLRRIGIDVRRKLFKQILDGIGSGLNLCVSGAAPIDKNIISFFNDIGIDFFNGYGLTETSPVISVCNYFVNVYGSVGNPLAFIEVAIDTDDKKPGTIGEILTRSDSVMIGYFENPEATAEAITEEGWLRTGDMGYLDKKDCLYITGRTKSMIVLPNGKKAFPEEIEFLISQIPGIKESFVWGDTTSGNVDICAKFVINSEELPEGLAGNHSAIKIWLEDQVDKLNQKLPPYKAIKYFIISEDELIKTTTMKVKRAQEQERISKKLAELGLTMKTAHGQVID